MDLKQKNQFNNKTSKLKSENTCSQEEVHNTLGEVIVNHSDAASPISYLPDTALVAAATKTLVLENDAADEIINTNHTEEKEITEIDIVETNVINRVAPR